MKDLYEIMGLTKTATEEDIKKTYRQLARQFHPDRNPGDKEAEEKFKELQSAYDVLGDAQKKSDYDTYGTVEKTGSNRRGKPFTSTVDDFFTSFFGDRGKQTSVGAHIPVEIEITLEDVFHGGERDINFNRRERCLKCNGAGGVEAKCHHCNGTGHKIIRGAAMTVRASCQACNGSGKVISEVCMDCVDGYSNPIEEMIKFKIPPGVEDGMRFVQRGMGEPPPDPQGIPGDLYIIVKVRSHEFFSRLSNGNLLLEVPVSYSQLVLGDEIEVPTIAGKKVGFKILAGTQVNSKFRLTDLGLPIFNNGGSIYDWGDQLVQVKLEVPVVIEDRHKELVSELAALEKINLTPLRKEYFEKLGAENGKS